MNRFGFTNWPEKLKAAVAEERQRIFAEVINLRDVYASEIVSPELDTPSNSLNKDRVALLNNVLHIVKGGKS